jgi:hypothetical protein
VGDFGRVAFRTFHDPTTTHNKQTTIGIHNWEEVFLDNVYPEVTFLQRFDGTSKVLCHPEYATAFLEQYCKNGSVQTRCHHFQH